MQQRMQRTAHAVVDFSVLILVFVVVFMLICVASARAAPPTPEFMAAKQAFTIQMRKKQPAMRVTAVTTVADVIQPETAELLLKRGITDDDASVQQAARIALKQLADDRSVRQYLLTEIKKSFRKQSPDEVTIELFRALIVTDDEERQAEMMKVLDDYLSSSKGNPLAPMIVIDDLGVQDDAEAARVVKLLSTSKAFDANFGYRRCVVQAMSKIRQSEAVDFLIEILPKTQGLIQHDVIQYLTRLTKQKFRDNDREWNTWWKENQRAFEFPAAGVALPEIANDEQQLSYYGIPICAKRIVFALDTSASMRGLPFEAAKIALLKAVDSLPEAVAFDLVFFDANAQSWLPRLVPATKDAKREASRIIVERGLKLGTASNEALNAAFGLEPEAIYFLSDGEPTDGAPPAIVNAISRMNKTRRISIHTIGVVTQRNGGAGLTMFMQPLANRNYGTFRLVE